MLILQFFDYHESNKYQFGIDFINIRNRISISFETNTEIFLSF